MRDTYAYPDNSLQRTSKEQWNSLYCEFSETIRMILEMWQKHKNNVTYTVIIVVFSDNNQKQLIQPKRTISQLHNFLLKAALVVCS